MSHPVIDTTSTPVPDLHLHALRAVTDEDVAAYERDGVV